MVRKIMGFFDFLKPKPNNETYSILVDLIENNADQIVLKEGKPRSEAIYLSICMAYEDLRTRPNGHEGRKALMKLVEDRYRAAHNDVMTYIAGTRGRIELKPEYEVALIARRR
jgi:hypothetical protein